MKPWPWSGDTREDKAKRIAQSYRQLAVDIINGEIPNPPTALTKLDQRWLEHGAFWAVPSQDPYDPTQWVHAVDAAHYADVEPGTIRKWAERGHIRVDHDHNGAPIYNIGDLRANEVRQRQERERTAHRRPGVTPTL